MENVIAMTYGKALFDAAKELEQVCEIEEEIKAIDEIFKEEKDFTQLLGSPAVTAREKKSMIRDIFGSGVREEVLSFLYILIDHNRCGQYHAIVKLSLIHISDGLFPPGCAVSGCRGTRPSSGC